MLDQCLALRRRENIADIAEQLHEALGGLVGQFQMFGACRLQRGAIHVCPK